MQTPKRLRVQSHKTALTWDARSSSKFSGYSQFLSDLTTNPWFFRVPFSSQICCCPGSTVFFTQFVIMSHGIKKPASSFLKPGATDCQWYKLWVMVQTQPSSQNTVPLSDLRRIYIYAHRPLWAYYTVQINFPLANKHDTTKESHASNNLDNVPDLQLGSIYLSMGWMLEILTFKGQYWGKELTPEGRASRNGIGALIRDVHGDWFALITVWGHSGKSAVCKRALEKCPH